MTKVNAVISTGMSRSGDVDRIVKTFDKHRRDTKNFVILHCTSGYPTPPEEINLNVITALKAKYVHFLTLEGLGVTHYPHLLC